MEFNTVNKDNEKTKKQRCGTFFFFLAKYTTGVNDIPVNLLHSQGVSSEETIEILNKYFNCSNNYNGRGK